MDCARSTCASAAPGPDANPPCARSQRRASKCAPSKTARRSRTMDAGRPKSAASEFGRSPDLKQSSEEVFKSRTKALRRRKLHLFLARKVDEREWLDISVPFAGFAAAKG